MSIERNFPARRERLDALMRRIDETLAQYSTRPKIFSEPKQYPVVQESNPGYRIIDKRHR